METKRVLCVDDDPETLKLRKLLLEATGYSAVTATSGEEALRILERDETFDLVLLDYLMPGMKGDELAQKLRLQHPDLPLVAVSAVGQLPPALLENTDATVQKGQDPQVLLSIVSILTRSKRGAITASPSRTVLCVEDEPLQLKLRKMLFESAGYHVLEAQSATAALDAFCTSSVDAVVMDYWLSGQNGTSLAEEMKRMRPKVPIVMLSGFSALPGEGAVVDSWLRKAEIGPEELLDEVDRLIQFRIPPEQAPS